MEWQDSLTHEELQVAVMLLLGKAKLSAADKNELRFATAKGRANELDMRRRLARLLAETPIEREEKRETP